MFDSIGFQEILLIGLVALLVIGPKDLPLLARKMGREMAKLRNMAGEFRASFDELARQAELDELRKEVEALKGLKPLREVQDALSEPVDLSISQALSTPEAFSPDAFNKDAVVGLDSPPVAPVAEVPAIDIGVQKLMAAKAAAKAAAKTAQEAAIDAVAGAQQAPTRARRTAAKPIPEVAKKAAKPAPKKATAPKKSTKAAPNSASKSASNSASKSGPKKSAAKESTLA